MNSAVVDSNVLIALVDDRDALHVKATALLAQVKRQPIQLVYFDCVLNETWSVLGRRLEEQKRSHGFNEVIERVQTRIPDDLIVWVSSDIQRLYAEIIDLIKQTSGKLNFHDALIALKCRELNIESILSFDKDFDQIDWVTRIS